MQDAVQAKLDERFGKAKWILNAAEWLSLDRELIRQKKLDLDEVERVAADAARAIPHVARVYTRGDLLAGRTSGDAISRRVLNGFHPLRSPDLMVILEPYWIYAAKGATHGSPYNYDSHVPIIFMGPGIKPGKYNKPARPERHRPTIATMLEVEIPSGSSGRVLEEMLANGL